MRWSAALFALPVVAACAAPAGPSVRRHEAPIVHGVDENGYPAVLYLYNNAGVACTGSLIADRVVLTAKHCVADVPEDGWFAGTGPTGDDAWYEGASVVTTGGAQMDGVDIALITLRESLPVTPVPVARAFEWYGLGDTLTLVGYGQTEDGSAGRKKRTTSVIELIGPEPDSYVADNEFALLGDGTGADHGDSGGPVFDGAGTQVGVMVRADGEQWTICTRIDRFLALVDGAIDDAGDDPGPDDPGPGPDPDPDPDPGHPPAGALGASCGRAADCASGLCEDAHCTSRCDVLDSSNCPDGFYCDARGSCGDGRCVAGTPGTRRIGNECDRDEDCATLLCANLGDGTASLCATPCPAGGGRGCPDGTICHATTEGCGACVRAPDTQGAFGTGCAADGDCSSGICFAPGPTGVCTAPCGLGGRCAPGFECDGRLCAPAGGRLGESCQSKTDCATSVCGRDADGNGLCTQPCTADDECGDGFACAQTTGGGGACWPSDGSAAQRSSGCGIAPDGATPAASTSLLLLALALASRRRHPR